MANWDHLSNIGTHPVLDPDPRVSLPAKIEAAQRHIDRFTEIRNSLQAELNALDPEVVCYHPLSCSSCQSHGGPCGKHHVGDVGHDRCKGRGV